MNNFTRETTPSYCLYYQATVVRENCWFVVAVLKSFDHISLDRTIDSEQSIFEFFVPHAMHTFFLDVITTLIAQGYVHNLRQMPNRLLDESEQV